MWTPVTVLPVPLKRRKIYANIRTIVARIGSVLKNADSGHVLQTLKYRLTRNDQPEIQRMRKKIR